MCGRGRGLRPPSKPLLERSALARINDAGLALLEDAELGEGALDSQWREGCGRSRGPTVRCQTMLDRMSYEAAIPNVDGSEGAGFADEDLSTAGARRGVSTWQQDPLPDASLLNNCDMDLLDDAVL